MTFNDLITASESGKTVILTAENNGDKHKYIEARHNSESFSAYSVYGYVNGGSLSTMNIEQITILPDNSVQVHVVGVSAS